LNKKQIPPPGKIIDAYITSKGAIVLVNDQYIPKTVQALNDVLNNQPNYKYFYEDENGKEITDYQYLLDRHQAWVKQREPHVKNFLKTIPEGQYSENMIKLVQKDLELAC
jgi:hypothetical protein